ncbi:Crp/Fnr family transcriptional regulator [Methylobacterium nigriterrae]|uniref:Crp/Fnr family transcriptional regulator n=1 Tax=Methylobacterium nigriterrae TaxID=3127512 RepID=UPI003013B089
MIGVDPGATRKLASAALGVATPDAVVAKLGHGADLDHAEAAALFAALGRSERAAPRTRLVEAGGRSCGGLALLDGFACRYRQTQAGRRQITALLLPGDLHDPQAGLANGADHGVMTLSYCTIASVPAETLERLKADHPRIRQALTWAMLAEVSTAREWIVSLATRSAAQRLAHLLCEVSARLRAAGHAVEAGRRLPLCREDLVDTLGVSPVLLNRIVAELAAAGLIACHDRALTILDHPRLQAFVAFDPAYLHLRCIG